jgi:cardiolipin synthase A/B
MTAEILGVVSLVTAIVFHMAGVLHAIHSLMKTRTSQGSIAWIMALIAVPYVAVPLYWFLGRDRFTGYVRARRAHDIRLSKKADDLYKMIQPFEIMDQSPFTKLSVKLAKMPYLKGNRLDLFDDGKETFNALFESIEKARNYVLVSYYIMKHDHIGDALQQLLIRKAKLGVRVLLLFDEMGSSKLPRKFLQEMKRAGVEFSSFGTNRFWWSRLQYNFRNHRKIVVSDGSEAFIGGLNIADEYLGWHPTLGYWRDTHMRLNGPAALAVQLVFFEDWFWATGDVPECIPQLEEQKEDQRLLILPTGPADHLDSWQLFVVAACNAATKKLWIATPYFVPDGGVISALQSAALRGVEVKILIPNKADSFLVNLATYSYYDQILSSGVKIFRYTKGFLHQKVLLLDEYAALGTANLDNRSFRLNFEITGFTNDSEFVGKIERMLAKDFESSVESFIEDYNAKSFLFNAACRAARLFSPIL